MSEYKPLATAVWTTTCPQIKEERSKGRITTLIYLSKEGDTKAKDRLLREFTPTIEMLAKDMVSRNCPNADLGQAMKVGKDAFIDSLKNYDYKYAFEPHMKLYVIYEISRFLAQ